jgi:hypothetical protein
VARNKEVTSTTEARIEQWPIERLVPYARNPRKNDHAVEQMVVAIKEFGFKIPILARSDGTVVDGHLRLKAAHVLQLERVPVILCDEWDEAKVKAFRLLANRSVTWAEWDDDLLSLEFQDLKDLDFDLKLTGFDDAKIESLFGMPVGGSTDENWRGMPEFTQEDADGYSIKVHFRSPKERDQFAQLVNQTITDRTRYIWFPFEPEDSSISEQYVAAES